MMVFAPAGGKLQTEDYQPPAGGVKPAAANLFIYLPGVSCRTHIGVPMK
jgi:hypothetical protein